MKPTQDYVYVTQVEAEKTTSGGIILTGDTTTGTKPAKILEVGPDVTSVTKGQTVYLKWNDGLAVTHQGTQGALVPEKSILAIV